MSDGKIKNFDNLYATRESVMKLVLRYEACSAYDLHNNGQLLQSQPSLESPTDAKEIVKTFQDAGTSEITASTTATVAAEPPPRQQQQPPAITTTITTTATTTVAMSK